MNAEVSVIPKISRPPIANGYYCTELHDLLDELHSKQLIVISGPSGIGKSTLVATYIESRNIPTIWCQVDKGENNPENFFYCFDIALHEANPNKKFSLPHLKRKDTNRIAEFTKEYFQEFYRHLEVPFLIVLDNYQEIAEDSSLHEVIKFACSELPKGGRFVIITTKRIPSAFAQLRDVNMVAIIESEDFQMSPSKLKPLPAYPV